MSGCDALAPFTFRVGHLDEANALVIAHHYSKRAPANVQVVGTWHAPGGLFGDRGDAVAACFICIPPTRWKEPVFELSRLVRAPHVTAPLTGLIAATCRHAARIGVDLIVSFADQTQGHHGGIYQAASWKYAGYRKPRMDGVLIDGVFYAGRSCNSNWGTQSPEKLRIILREHNVQPHYDEGKHLYWRALTRSGQKKAERLGLASLPYPKPDMQS